MDDRASKGGLARAAKLTPEQRSEIARKGGKARMAQLSPQERTKFAQRAIQIREQKKGSL